MSKVDSTSRIDGSNSQGRVMSNFQGIRAALRLMAAAALSLLIAFGASAQTVRYIHTDGLGSVVLVTDKDRNVIERSEYEPYGSLLNRPITDGPGYSGHVMDASTGLSYMQQRYYDPVIGRFLSVDPIPVTSNSPKKFSRYFYANNSPYGFIDPDGRQSCLAGFCDSFSESDQTPNASQAQQQSDQELGKPPIQDMDPIEVTAPKASESSAPIIGRAQASSKTPTHASTSQRIAEEFAKMSDVMRVHLNRSLRNILGDNAPNIRPDVTVEMKNGDVHNIEVRSNGQKASQLRQKLAGARGPMGRAGQDIVVDPDPMPSVELPPEIFIEP
ncbi:RHS repeat-associated core domain-containing protein [Xanthomonas sacchari]|uniref:RHS repeat domain-containing protein n=1 Tax=Xanthomonas sacchari TaxID=56458 RepID=UPI00225BC415|nr:RHS repeat-associated core domain-containing protein [Xanthomonas sacchari]MCW0402865.1 hypothetical protein [Xanthomonas sacchari]